MTNSSNVPQSQNNYETITLKIEAITTCASDDNDGNDNEHIYEEIPDKLRFEWTFKPLYISLLLPSISVSVIV